MKRRTPATVDNATAIWMVGAADLQSECRPPAVELQSFRGRFAVCTLTAIASSSIPIHQLLLPFRCCRGAGVCCLSG
jgi:hypothetical protein